MSRSRFLALVGLTAVSFWAPSASAYVRTVTSAGAPMYWNRTVMNLTVYVGDPPAPLTSEDVALAVRGAAATWSRGRVACTSLDLRVEAAPQASAPVRMDGVSRVTFRREEWCKDPRLDGDSCYDPFALAVTSVFARRSDGQIIDADIELNAVTFRWSDLVRKPEEGQVLQDLQNTLTHEIGHFIGLDHTCFLATVRAGTTDDHGAPVPSCAQATDEVRATTMFAAVIPGDLERRSLSPDDRRAVCDVYRPVDLILEPNMPVGCSAAPGRANGAAGLVVLAVLATCLSRRRRPATGSRSSRCHAHHR